MKRNVFRGLFPPRKMALDELLSLCIYIAYLEASTWTELSLWQVNFTGCFLKVIIQSKLIFVKPKTTLHCG